MFYISLGDDKEYSAMPKKFSLKVYEYGRFTNEYPLEWTSNTACTLSHAYMLDEHNNLFWKAPLSKTISVRKRERVVIPEGDIDFHVIPLNTNRTEYSRNWKLT